MKPPLTEPGAIDTSPATCEQFLLYMSCAPPLIAAVAQNVVKKIARTLPDIHILHDGVSTSWAAQSGKTTLNCEYRKYKKKKKMGKNYKTMYTMSYEGCDVMLRYFH